MRKIIAILSLFILVIVGVFQWKTILQNVTGSPTAYAVGDLTVNWGVPEGNPIFTIFNMAPGQSQSRNVSVINSSPVPRLVAVMGELQTDTGNMKNALLITMSQGIDVLYGPKTLSQFFADSSTPDGVPLSNITSGGSATYTFNVLFDPSSGNEFQNKSITFNLHIGVSTPTPAACLGITFNNPPIFGTSGNDTLLGTSGNDLIISLEGNDTIVSKEGSDCVVSGLGNDIIQTGLGNDIVSSEQGGDTIVTGVGNDTVIGGLGNDTITSDAGNDTVNGNEGNDVVTGGDGVDILRGDAGSDIVNGGAGSDSCSAEIKVSCEINL